MLDSLACFYARNLLSFFSLKNGRKPFSTVFCSLTPINARTREDREDRRFRKSTGTSVIASGCFLLCPVASF
jgi:hypothetical protein